MVLFAWNARDASKVDRVGGAVMPVKPKPRYYIYTWDTYKQKFTPQSGVRCGPYSLFGLRKAIRKLREIGYPCNYHNGDGDPSVLVERAS